MPITVLKYRDVADGVQAGQFEIGERSVVQTLDEIDSAHKELLAGRVTAVVSVTGSTGLSNLTPVWFDYAGDLVLLNLAAHRKKVEWLRKNPKATFLLMNPANDYHWLSIKATVVREIHEDDPAEGHRATETIDRMYTKYTGNPGPYAVRDPSRDERRILFELRADSVATFGRP
jgi:nitroimidazol reductase NimA-like FMN-containing flavoprotein (pyridoxamine 5'-phosphate oxidase superfamily)